MYKPLEFKVSIHPLSLLFLGGVPLGSLELASSLGNKNVSRFESSVVITKAGKNVCLQIRGVMEPFKPSPRYPMYDQPTKYLSTILKFYRHYLAIS